MAAQLWIRCSQCQRNFRTVRGLREHKALHAATGKVLPDVTDRLSGLPSPRWDRGSRALPEQWWG